MKETELIAEVVRRGSEGEAWHGPSIREALTGVTAADAAGRPIANAHSIWEIVLHMTAWASEVERRLRAYARPLQGEADWPPVTATDEEHWETAKSALKASHARLRDAVREFSPTRLSDRVEFGNSASGDDGSFYIMLHGLAQHDAYHSGQIAMLKKALLTAAA